MITKFGCKNIKAIRTFTKIDIKPITIIMGENSSGKSSLLQALSLLYVNTIFGQTIQKIKYNNPFSHFGDNNSFKNKGEDIELYFEIDDKDTKLLLIYKDDEDNSEYGILKSIKIDNDDMTYTFILNDLGSYDISIETIKNSEYDFFIDLNMSASSKLNAIMYMDDTKEHYNISEILFTPIDLLTNQLQSIRHVGKLKDIKATYDYPNDYIGYFGEKYKDIAKNLSSKLYINKAIKNIFHYEIKKIDKDTGEFYLSDEKIKKNLSLNMFGSSVSSTMPILTQYARNREKDIKDKYRLTIIEEPEINEHPMSQAKLVESLFPKNRPKQHFNIIETHSEHIVNKLRYMVYKKELKSNDVVIYYKIKESNEFINIGIDKKGFFVNNKGKYKFPKGFYDATLEEIFEIETNNL